MADTLSDLYTKSPGTAQVASTPNATSSDATASNATAGSATATTQDVPNENLTSSRLNTITSQDSPLMQRARQEGMLLAARRGLQNSSIAAGAAQGALVDRAAPIAQQEAGLLQEQRLANQTAQNNASITNAGLSTDVSKLNAQLGTQTSMQNAQNATETSRFNAETAAQAAQQNAQAENAMRTAVMNQNAELNKQYLQGTQSMDLATIQAQYQVLLQTNAAASNLYNNYFTTIAQVMANKDIDPARAAQIVQTLQQSLVGGMDFIDAMNGTPTGTSTPTTSGGDRFYPTPRIPAGAQVFNAAGGEAATTNGYLSNAKQVLMSNFAKQATVAPAPAQTNSVTSSAPTQTGNTTQLPAGAESSAYGGLLSGAGSLARAAGNTQLAKDAGISDALGAAGKVASGAGGVLQTVGGIQQGGVEGYTSAVQGALQTAGALGSSTAGAIAPYVGIAKDVAGGDYIGAAVDTAGLLAGGPIAALGMAAAALTNKAFFSDGSKDRNVAAYKNATKSTQVTLPLGKYGLNLVVMPKGDGSYTLVSAQTFNDLAGSWYGAVFHPDGNADDWKAKYLGYVQNMQQATLPKGYSFDTGTGKIMYKGKVAGNYG